MTENKEKGICILLLNLITGGLGTILYGVLIKNMDCCLYFYRDNK